MSYYVIVFYFGRVKLTQFKKSMDSLSVEDLSQEIIAFEQGRVNSVGTLTI